MSSSNGPHFDSRSFWRYRLRTRGGLDVVGHRAMGNGYNREIYARREEVLQNALDELGLDLPCARVLEVGCGGGYYVDFWQQRAVRSVVGVDLSQERVSALSDRYPDYRFVSGDMADLSLPELGGERFDVATLFDVLYHIVDDEHATGVLQAIAACLATNGVLLLFDQLAPRSTSLRRHVVFRDRDRFERLLERAGLQIRFEAPLFLFLLPPVTGVLPVDYAVHAAFAVFGRAIRHFDGLSGAIGGALRRSDRYFLSRGLRIPNQRLFVIEHRDQASSHTITTASGGAD